MLTNENVTYCFNSSFVSKNRRVNKVCNSHSFMTRNYDTHFAKMYRYFCLHDRPLFLKKL